MSLIPKAFAPDSIFGRQYHQSPVPVGSDGRESCERRVAGELLFRSHRLTISTYITYIKDGGNLLLHKASRP
jgi:hypothetical protein